MEDGGGEGEEKRGQRRGDVEHKASYCEQDNSFEFGLGSFLLNLIFVVPD